jgi:hypothetical protein
VEDRPEWLGSGPIQNRAGGVRPGGLLDETVEPLAPGGVDGVSDRGAGTPEVGCDGGGRLAVGAGQKDLSPADREGIGRAERLAEAVPLIGGQRRHEELGLHLRLLEAARNRKRPPLILH